MRGLFGAAGAGRQCVPASPVRRFCATVQLHRFRFRMHWAPAFFLTVLAALGSGSVRGQTNNAVLIRMASDDTCLVADLPVSCREVGAKLRALGIPPDADIQFGIDGYRTYEAIRTMMDSLRQAGYKVDKVGFITKPQT